MSAAAEQRTQRMLEELLTLPGNGNCADCHAPAPRWASVNLGIFLCVGCASVHRKLGTHQSRVKSVTLDTWTREQIVSVRSIGNSASNAIYNPNEALHPPPPSYGHDERDGEIEKYIRRKYEQCAFKGGAAARMDGRAEPTSMNRMREREGRLQSGMTGSLWGKENRKNPELNDIVTKKERDLPPLPVSPSINQSNGGDYRAPPRSRPVRSPSTQNIETVGPVWNTADAGSGKTTPRPKEPDASLIDMSSGTTSTLPLQINMTGNPSHVHPHPQAQVQAQGQGQFLSAQPTSWGMAYSTSPQNEMMINGFSTSPQPQMSSSFGQNGMYNTHSNSLSPQPAYGQQLSLSPPLTYMPNMSTSPSYQSFQHSPSFQQQSLQQQQFGQQQFQTQPQQQQQQYGQYQQMQQGQNGGQMGMGGNMGMVGQRYGYQTYGNM